MGKRVVVGWIVLAACGSYGGEGDRSSSSASSSSGGSSGAAFLCTDPVLYVSSRGDDANDGCDPELPKRTLTSAIGAVQAKGSPAEIRTCAETIRERVVLAYPASILGGFDCTTWAAGAGRTRIEAPDDREVETVIVFGAVVDGNVRLEHLEVEGPARASGYVSAVRVKDGAAPVLRDLDVAGGSTGEGHAVALAIESASPTVEDSTVRGGRAKCTVDCTTVTTTALGINGGNPRLRRIRVEGGEAEVTPAGLYVGTIAVDVVGPTKAAGADAFTGLDITTGVGHVGGNYAAMGFRATDGVDIDLVDSRIAPGPAASTCALSPCTAMGAGVGNGTVRIARGRIVATDTTGALPDVVTRPVAVHASIGAVLSVSSSLLHATGTAIEVTPGGTAEVKASTAIAPEVVANSGTLSVRSSALAHARPASPPLFLSSCGGPTKTTFDSNVFVGASSGFSTLYTTKSGSCAGEAFATLAATVAASDASNAIAATATSRIAASCTGEDPASCVVDPACAAESADGTACLRAVFAAVTDPFFGRAEILSVEGLRLRPMVTCKIAQGGVAFPEIATDVYGAPRTAPISVGAHEYDGACSN